MSDSPAPPRILRLDDAVVNRIAAGEVIQRPANALKELIENSLDAHSNSIAVVVNQGGLKLLQITDNGTGIRREDLNIVCERFTTSKLRVFEDLSTIGTYGFRGEALASISHVARLTIVTKTKDEVCGYRTRYSDGKPLGNPVPCAANQGTQITVEDVFFNVPARKRALKSGSEEFHKIADVVSKYAIHNAGVAFSLKKEGDQTLYVRTQRNSSILDNISSIFGQTIGKELIKIQKTENKLRFKMDGYVSNVNFNTKRFNFLLFINHRLVDCSSLKKAIEMVYEAYLPKGTHPFVYMSLEIDSHLVDVNVHPTKHEVHFLHQEEIIESIQQCLDAKLLGSNSSRTYYTQTILPGVPKIATETALNVSSPSSSSSVSISEKDFVRTDSKIQKLDKFVVKLIPSGGQSNPDQTVKLCEEGSSQEGSQTLSEKLDCMSSQGSSQNSSIVITEDTQELSSRYRREIKLASVNHLRSLVTENGHSGLQEVIANHTFVGCVDQELALIQHATKLFLVNISRLSEALFYQIMLKDFGNFGYLRLNPPAPVKKLAIMALNQPESGWTEADGNKEVLANYVLECLQDHAEMLDDYFSMELDKEGNLVSLPNLVKGFVPFFRNLPIFIVRLATEVNWNEEEPCFESFCREVAKFYAVSKHEEAAFNAKQHASHRHEDPDFALSWKKTVEHDILGTAKRNFIPPKAMANDMTFVQVANLPDLYKVFERC